MKDNREVPTGTTTDKTSFKKGQPKDRPIVVHENGYVGSESCRNCHADQFSSWHISYHRTMTQVATPKSVIGDFNDVKLTLHGHAVHLTREGDEFFYEGPDLQWSGPPNQRPRVKRKIVQTTGSHHMQVYWHVLTGQGRMLGILPFSWLNQEARWVPRSAVFLRPPPTGIERESGHWNLHCLRCHTTDPQPRFQWSEADDPVLKKLESVDTHVGEFGIACEACHGPGGQHVEWHEGKKQGPEANLVVPTQLNVQLSSQVCGHCHSLWNFEGEQEFFDWTEAGFQYRPGDELNNAVRKILRANSGEPAMDKDLDGIPRVGVMWSDGMVRVSGREYNGLIESPCFNHANESKQMSCMSCHAMHPDTTELDNWADDMLEPEMRTNQACTQCHEKFGDSAVLTAHTRHQTESSGSLCTNCHMPHTTYGLLKAIRSHTIDSPTVQVSVATGRPNACNQCHLDKTLAWTATHLDEWYGIEQPELDKEQQTIAASILWALKGDAGQRALMAWSMGWPAAREISNTDWMNPFIMQLMVDEYEAVRIIAARTIHKQEGFEHLEFDPTAGKQDRLKVVNKFANDGFVGRPGEKIRTVGPHLLFSSDGTLLSTEFKQLLKARDRRPMHLLE